MQPESPGVVMDGGNLVALQFIHARSLVRHFSCNCPFASSITLNYDNCPLGQDGQEYTEFSPYGRLRIDWCSCGH